MSKSFKIVGEDVSDGYHTFADLYDHRIALFMALARMSGWPAYHRADDGTPGWFCLYLETPMGQISYHLPDKMLPFVTRFAKEAPEEYKWDGHSSADVIFRLHCITLVSDRVLEDGGPLV